MARMLEEDADQPSLLDGLDKRTVASGFGGFRVSGRWLGLRRTLNP